MHNICYKRISSGPPATLLYSKGDDIMKMDLSSMETSILHTDLDVEKIYKMGELI